MEKKRFIHSETINKAIYKNRLMPNYPNEKRKGRCGKLNVQTQRSNHLNYYGNPVYSVSVKDCKTGKTTFGKSSSLSMALMSAIRKTGTKIKY